MDLLDFFRDVGGGGLKQERLRELLEMARLGCLADTVRATLGLCVPAVHAAHWARLTLF